MRASYVVLLFLATALGKVCESPSAFQSVLKTPHPDWEAETHDFLQREFTNCFNPVTEKPKNCDPQKLERLSELIDTTSPTKLGPGYPIGVKPDTNQALTDEIKKEALKHERKAAQKVARNGYEVRYASDENLFDPETRKLIEAARQEHHLPRNANFDLLVNGKPFDVYSPLGKTGLDSIRKTLEEKSIKQTGRIVLYSESGGNLSHPEFRKELQKILRDSPPEKLHEVLIVKEDGTVSRLFP